MTSLSTTDILQLEDHRARRRRRLRLAESLHSVDDGRGALVSHLADVADVVSADRVSALWVDEYGPGIAHPHVVVDLLSDRPRRSFYREPLRTARENGVPGVYEYRGGDLVGRSPASGEWGLVVSLGSDGTRTWFLVADSVSPRPSLSSAQRNEVMFLSGECSAVVLHRDLDGPAAGAYRRESEILRSSPSDDRRFPGWSVLRDLEGRDEDDLVSQRIALRFIVARLPVLLVEDDLALPEERRREQAQRARDELLIRGGGLDMGREAALWSSVLAAFEKGDLPELAGMVLALGLEAERQGHLHGAGELLTAGYEIAAGSGETSIAVECARMAGRTARRRASWSEAHRWYEVGRGVARAMDWLDREAVVLDGVATTHRERGNLPAARTVLNEALALAERSGNDEARGRVHHGFLGLEQAAGNMDEAVQHGWRAVSLYREDGDRMRGLAGLAALFQDMGRWDAAEDAWLLVRHLSREDYYTRYAVDALSHLAALRGDAATFARRAAESDALGWDSAPGGAKADMLLHRGLSYAALGRMAEARRWFTRTMAYAEEAGFSRTLFQAEKSLESLDSGEDSHPPEPRDAPSADSMGVEADLHAMRCELVGASG